MISEYQTIFEEEHENDKEVRMRSQAAITELVDRFYPLFKKYLSLIKTGQINFGNIEQRLFVALFMDNPKLKAALYGKMALDKDTKSEIYQRFNFIKEGYGHLDSDEILVDLKLLFLNLAKRYNRTGKSFCCYVAYSYRYELFRHIQKFYHNPLNIHYKNIQYEDCAKIDSPDVIDESALEDHIYENMMGLPDMTWINGENCSEIFSCLTPEERKIISKYYLENMCDRQIAEEYGLHINTCNQKRRTAINKIAESIGIDPSSIRRSRNSGKKRLK